MGVRLRSIRVAAAFALLGALLAPSGAGAQQLDPSVGGGASDPSDASLASLSLTGAELGFDAAETQYWVAYGAPTAHPTIEAAAAQPGAQIAFSPADADPDTAGYQVATSGLQVVRVNVTSPDGTARRSYVLWLFDYRLRSLGLEGHDIGFDRLVADYSITVPNDVDTVTVTADGRAHTLAYGSPDADPDSDGHQVSLDVGVNEITVTATPKPTRVIATPQTYTITVDRLPQVAQQNQADPHDQADPQVPTLSDDASLSSLTLSGASLSFAAATTSYDVDFVTAADHTTITAAAAHSAASVDISPADADATAPGHQVAITAGAATAVTVTVTAEDTTTTETYRLNISDARLQGLAVTGHDIGYDPATAAYTLTVPHSTDTVTVSTGTEPNAKLNIAYSPADADTTTDGHQVDLSVGANTVTVTATLTGGTDSQAYTVTVDRLPQVAQQNQVADDDATLASMTLTGATIDFDPSTTSYAVMYVAAADYATLAATATHPNATVSIDVDDDADTAGNQVRIVTDHTVNVTVTAADGVTTKRYQVSVWNVRLRGLAVVGYDIGFDPATAAYSLSVPHSVDTVTVGTGSESNPKLAIVYSPADSDTTAGHQAGLAVGANTITATVTLMGGTDTQTYTVTVTRAAAATDARLASLSIDPGFLRYDRFRTSHTAYILPTTQTVTVAAEATQTAANVEITPADADTVTDGHQIDTTADSVTVTVKVTSADSSATSTHTVTVKHRPGGFVKVDVGYGTACALHLSGRVLCWGRHRQGFYPPARNGQLARSPAADEVFVDIIVGEHGSCGVRPDNTLHCWYRGSEFGSMPDGDVWSVAHLERNNCWLDLDRHLHCPATYSTWFGGDPRMPEGKTIKQYRSVAMTRNVACAVGFDQKVDCFGYGPFYRNSPEGDFVVIDGGSGGTEHYCGVKTDGTVRCWVYDRPAGDYTFSEFYAQAGPYIDVGVTNRDKCGVKADNSLHCWIPRNPAFPRIGLPPSSFSYETLSVDSRLFSCGLTTDGYVKCSGGRGEPGSYAPVFDDSSLAEASLSGLSLSFDPDTTSYFIEMGHDKVSTTVTATALRPGKTVLIAPADADPNTDGHQVDLVGDSVTVTVTVTSLDETATTTYTFEISREAPPDEARLEALSISDVTLSFDDDTYLYRVDVAADVESVTVSPTAYHDDATVVVLPADADSNTDGHQVSLTAGAASFITITSMSQDTTEVVTYTVVVTRPTS